MGALWERGHLEIPQTNPLERGFVQLLEACRFCSLEAEEDIFGEKREKSPSFRGGGKAKIPKFSEGCCFFWNCINIRNESGFFYVPGRDEVIPIVIIESKLPKRSFNFLGKIQNLPAILVT